MARCNRLAPGGMVFHVLNRGVGGMKLFQRESDFAAFERVIGETLKVRPMRICCYCLMPTHWHLLVWPEKDGELAAFMQRLTITHVAAGRGSGGGLVPGIFTRGGLSRFLSPGISTSIMSPAMSSGTRCEPDWLSMWRLGGGRASAREHEAEDDEWQLSSWPVGRSRTWSKLVGAPQKDSELDALRESIRRGRPYGPSDWVVKTATELGLEASLRPRGRPRKPR